MEDLGLQAQEVMIKFGLSRIKPVASALVLSTLVGLSGCSFAPLRWPWQSSQTSNSPGELTGHGDADGKADASLPVLSELADSGIKVASDEELAACVKASGLDDEVMKLADSTNFGTRESVDDWGRTLKASPELIVLHETVISEPATVNLFQTPHPRDEDQVSYHMLIGADGARLRIVPDQNRAYGSGMSAFGDATQRRQPKRVGSINNVSLHVSLVTPADGRGNTDAHSGYTNAQYRSLAAQVLLWQAQYGIPLTRVTTHAAVDRSRTRYDPRSFRWDRFDPHYQEFVQLCGFERFDNGQAGL